MDKELCSHNVSIGTCTLEKGHTLGHMDETNGAQWWNRSSDHGPGAFSSIRHGDDAFRHNFRECEEYFGKDFRSIKWCPWCLRHLLNETREAVVENNPALLKEIDEALDV